MFSAQRELDVAQMISYYLLKAYKMSEIDYKQFSDIINNYNEISSLNYKIDLLPEKGIENKEQSARITTEDNKEIGAMSWAAVILNNYITLPIYHKKTDFDKGNSKKALIAL